MVKYQCTYKLSGCARNYCDLSSGTAEVYTTPERNVIAIYNNYHGRFTSIYYSRLISQFPNKAVKWNSQTLNVILK